MNLSLIEKRVSTSENESDNVANDLTSQTSTTSSSSPPTGVDLEIQDIEGVGPTTAKNSKKQVLFL